MALRVTVQEVNSAIVQHHFTLPRYKVNNLTSQMQKETKLKSLQAWLLRGRASGHEMIIRKIIK
jgi:hypothetical protein